MANIIRPIIVAIRTKQFRKAHSGLKDDWRILFYFILFYFSNLRGMIMKKVTLLNTGSTSVKAEFSEAEMTISAFLLKKRCNFKHFQLKNEGRNEEQFSRRQFLVNNYCTYLIIE